jgi:hypothetical protein
MIQLRGPYDVSVIYIDGNKQKGKWLAINYKVLK